MKDVSEFVPGREYTCQTWPKMMYIGKDRCGHFVFDTNHGIDTFPPYHSEDIKEYREPIKGSFWLNIYPGVVSDLMCRHSSKDVADKRATPDRIACIEVHYTEGDGL